uniref:Dmx-like 2 n=1 Tax=Saccoglossus kowalevskii TaxID=10224 RepID=A0ABM0MDN6_SACKO|nr:PREDICTED: Dmx-like 2 [Saccoglossus kowalevskii]
MNRHQVLTGAVNAGDSCFAIGHVDGIPFTVYAAGCDIVILASDFQRVQIIPGATHGNIQVGCIDCSAENGKIAASYANQVYIFEPTAVQEQSTHKLDYQWHQTGCFKIESLVYNLSWNQDGTRLLTGSDSIQLWACTSLDSQTVDDLVSDHDSGNVQEHCWECICQCKTASPIYHLKFSADGQYFASAGKADRLVKIWYCIKPPKLDQSSADATPSAVKYNFVYIAHPRAVTGFSWRLTSKYAPLGSVGNILMTSCRDNICRIWSESRLPSSSLVNVTPQPTHVISEKIAKSSHMRNKLKLKGKATKRKATQPDVPLPSHQREHDFHKHTYEEHHSNGLFPVHFHITAVINPNTDIPLLPAISSMSGSGEGSFVVHWLNNKEFQFTLSAETIIQDIRKKAEASDTSESKEDVTDSFSDVDDQDSSKDLIEFDVKLPAEDSSVGMQSSSSTSGIQEDAPLSDFSTQTSSKPLDHMIITDALSQKLGELLREWNECADMVFSIHPVDGSFLVWLVEYLDEYLPSCFRQAQISFSCRIPMAFPTGDATTMCDSLILYRNGIIQESKMAQKLSESGKGSIADMEKLSPSYSFMHSLAKLKQGGVGNNLIPQRVSMLSKHTNGTLNQWEIGFAENSKFSTVLSISHSSRCCGHKFRVNDLACHPVLPLLLTTSHHNIPKVDIDPVMCRSRSASFASTSSLGKSMSDQEKTIKTPTGLCSELILWRVDPVGPLSKSGGLKELARINSPLISAFSNIAWLPTLLPSSSLGPVSNSPSACFVASDGICLRLYQAVIDARSILIEVANNYEQPEAYMSSCSSLNSLVNAGKADGVLNGFKIVSLQSTARPGCIIELDPLTDAKQNWQNVQFMHVFQQQFITGTSASNPAPTHYEEMPGEPNKTMSFHFEETFYLVVVEKTRGGHSTIHMWSIELAAQPITPRASTKDGEQFQYEDSSPDVHPVSSSDESSRSESPLQFQALPHHVQTTKLCITSSKVCSHRLNLPEGVDIVSATPAAGHLSSSSIYPACTAPYLISAACSDGKVRFWHCKMSDSGTKADNPAFFLTTASDTNIKGQIDDVFNTLNYQWEEWELITQKASSSAVEVDGKPLTVSCAYNSRFACAYKVDEMIHSDRENKLNISVSVFECESTGGSKWLLEDSIHIGKVTIPDFPVTLEIGGLETQILNYKRMKRSSKIENFSQFGEHQDENHVRDNSDCRDSKNSMRQMIMQKRMVQLDWVSKEDGSHILTVGVGNKIVMYAPVSGEMANLSQLASSSNKQKQSSFRNPLISQKSLHVAPTLPHEEEGFKPKWVPLRTVELCSADSLPPLPMMLSWVRDGILVVGMESEMHVYSQWKSDDHSQVNVAEEKSPKDLIAVSSTQSIPLTITERKAHSSSSRSDSESQNVQKTGSKSDDSKSNLIQQCGLFEAAQLVSPVLPQYHPNQLMELMKCGKINRVKAILAHLVRCVAGEDAATKAVVIGHSEPRPKLHGRGHNQARHSISASPADVSVLTEEEHLDYIEITSIPPLPLYALMEADHAETGSSSEKPDINHGSYVNDLAHPDAESDHEYYAELFTTPNVHDDELILGSPPRRPEASPEVTMRLRNPAYFGLAQVRLLTNHLTHVHLPGLTSIEQMYLLALADTLATTHMDLAGSKTSTTTDGTVLGKEGAGYASSGRLSTNNENAADALDECGLRFLLAMRHHNGLLRALPPRLRFQLQQQGLSTASFAWAFHSEVQQEILAMIPAMQRGDPQWAELRAVGVGWWIRSNITLKTCIEKIAKSQFQMNNNPLDAALFYLAMKKKSLLSSLFRTVGDARMTSFFRNNFGEDRWRRAALKNAFALLGKQRFEHAAAFFLLAGALKDAIEVCIDKLEDIQLAMVIARLYEEDLEIPVTQKMILHENILGCDDSGTQSFNMNVSSDPFVRSISYWLLKDYTKSLETLLEQPEKSLRQDTSIESMLSDKQSLMDSCTSNPDVFNFYNYLRTHPLLVRRQFAGRDGHGPSSVLITGFSSIQAVDQIYQDEITPLERQLFFRTAHAHFVAGCPLSALEVLSKLPKVKSKEVSSKTTSQVSSRCDHIDNKDMIDTGTIIDSGFVKDNSDSFDWGQPIVQKDNKESLFDWSQPVGMPVEEKLELTWSDNDNDNDDNDDDDDDDDDDETVGKSDTESAGHEEEKSNLTSQEKDEQLSLGSESVSLEIDIMAQQLKFQACLKILMEELRTLATGFEVDGGQLRYQLYAWLEREVEALRVLCNYDSGEYEDVKLELMDIVSDHVESITQFEIPINQHDSKQSKTLHEVIMADRMDLEAKRERAERRKHWLKRNQNLLRTLLSYTSLHGSAGGGLASVKMELILLLQELQQEKTQQQLLSPLPFPTTLPLLSASVASAKTVVADPIVHLCNVTHDILHTVVQFTTPPRPGKNISVVQTLRTLSASLSSCVYQSLCDSDSCVTLLKQTTTKGMKVYSAGTHSNIIYRPGHLIGARKRHFSEENLTPTTAPSKWPGVSSLQSLLATERDEDMPKLNIFLCEALVAVYISLLVHAMTTNTPGELYRLIAHNFDAKMWSAVFGGGTKVMIPLAMTTHPEGSKEGDEMLAKQRRQLHLRLLGKATPQQSPYVTSRLAASSTNHTERAAFKEKFVSPEISLIDYFMVKPYVAPMNDGTNYESDESVSDEETPMDEDDDVFTITTTTSSLDEHTDYNSYSWCLMRYAIARLVLQKLQCFLPVAGIELAELPVASPLIHSFLKTLERWQQLLMGKLELFSSPPPDYISTNISYDPLSFTPQTGAPAILRYKAMLEPSNTPFRSNSRSALSVKRLWNFLVRQDHVQEIFIHYIFNKKGREHEAEIIDEIDSGLKVARSRIIHKEAEKISAFTINHANPSCMVVSTSKEILELDLSLILNPQPLAWIEERYDDTQTDSLSTSRSQTDDDFTIVHHIEKSSSSSTPTSHNSSNILPSSSSSSLTAESRQTGRGSTMLLKRQVHGVRRMASHPSLPYYLTGSTDGSVSLWEWGHTQKLHTHRIAGNYPKVTRIYCNPQGNKFGVADESGQLCLWQICGLTNTGSKPFLSLQCHNKGINDFAFIGSSSLLATAGLSSDNKNLCLWDTLLPHRSSLVQAFTCHEGGCPCLVFAPNQQLIISGGNRGDISIFDVRQRQLRHTFQAHDSGVKCLALDPTEEFFVTGSAEGDIKVWGLSVHNCMYSFPGEHARGTLFRSAGGGVVQLALTPSHNLFSCGADGTMKWRVIPPGRSTVNTF